MKADFQDRIDDYILDRMDVEDKNLFEIEVSQDDSKKQQLEFTQNTKRAINSRQEKLAKLDKMKVMYKHESRCSLSPLSPTGTDDCLSPSIQQLIEKKTKRQIWWWASGITAILVIGLFVINPFDNPSTSIDFSSDKMLYDGNYSFGLDSTEGNTEIKKDTISQDTIVIEMEETLKNPQ